MFFSLSFPKVCFHTILNKSKNIVFRVNFPPCLVFAFGWLQASISSFFTTLLPVRRLSFLSHMQFPLFWITVFVSILQLSFSIYILFLFIYRETSPCDHPVYTTTFCLTSHSLSIQKWKSPSHFINWKTSSMRPPRYYDQDFIAQRWSHQRVSTVFLNFSFPHYRTKALLIWENFPQAEGSPAYPSYPGKGNVSHISLQNKANKKLQKVGLARRVTHLVQSPFCNVRVSLLAGLTFLHKKKPSARFPFNKNFCLKFRKIHVPNGTVHSGCTDQTKATAILVIVLGSRVQMSGPGENNFVKWKGTFRSDRPDQIRSVSVKGSHSQVH